MDYMTYMGKMILAGDIGGTKTHLALFEEGEKRVEFNGKGVASRDNAPGWLFRLFDKINPF